MEAATELRRIVLTRFKAFEEFRLDIRSMNVLVGPNNCGKSTVLSAFRVLAAGLSKARNRNPEVLTGADGPARGYRISTNDLPIAAGNVHTNLRDTDTAIAFEFQNSTRLVLEFPSDGGCLLFAKNCNATPMTASAFRKAFPITVDHIPTLGPLDAEERLIEPATVRRGLNTHRAAGHFRNYWFHNPEHFAQFSEMLNSTWPSMEIEQPFADFAAGNSALFMMCKENRMAREVFWAGFGFQVWCQLLTHLVRTRESGVVVVDEPEIYLHADLQRQLMSILREMGPTFVLATHSSEIIAEAEPNEVVIIDKKHNSGRRIRKAAQVQDALDILGSGHNLILARIARSRRICFVEGKDARLLRMFARKLSKPELANSDDVIFVPIDGFTGWTRLDAFKWAFEQSLGERMKFFAVLDRDYRCTEENEEIASELREKLEMVHIHSRKEIENYFLVPSVITRVLTDLSGDADVFQTVIDIVSEELEDDTIAQYAARHADYHLRSGVDRATSIAEANRRFRSQWRHLESRMTVIPGKRCLSLLNREFQQRHNRTLTPSRIVSAMHVGEVPADMLSLIESLEQFRQS